MKKLGRFLASGHLLIFIALFFEVVSRCRTNSDPIIIDQRLGSGEQIHIYIRRVSTNPVSKVTALAAVILGVMGNS